MNLGIVGAEKAKFTSLGEQRAKQIVVDLLRAHMPSYVVSGHCHLGGIDIWAEEIAAELAIKKLIFAPANHNWSTGYGPRNRKIAQNSDWVTCIAVDKLPEGFQGMKFDHCYHCRKHGWDSTNHVKSGGCWTMHFARHLKKHGELIIVENY